jgi:ABC-type antimicrobial peptide transport system permease subunit
MRPLDYLALVFRSLRRSRLRSALTISAIVVGSTGITIMLTFVTAVKNEVVNSFVQSGQVNQIQVAQSSNLTYDPSGNVNGGGNQSGTSTMTDVLETKIAAIPNVTAVASTFQAGGGGQIQYLALGSKQLSVNRLSSYQPDGVIKQTLLAGHGLNQASSSNAVLITQDYADALGFKGRYAKLIGQQVVLHTGPGYTGVGAALPKTLPPQNSACGNNGGGGRQMCGPTSGLPAADLPATVVGIVSSSSSQQTIYASNAWLIGISNWSQPQGVAYPNSNCQGQTQCSPQGNGTVLGGWKAQTPDQFVALQGGYSSFIVDVNGTTNVAAVAKQIDQLGVSTATGLSALDQATQKANAIALILGALGMVALFIAALGVMNTMVMSVLERTREIGVMRALGARRSTIRRLFSFEAAGLGFFGGLFGVAIGYVFTIVAKPFLTKSLASSGQGAINFTVPIWLVGLVIGGTTLIGFLSGLFPARRAAKLDPVEALRYE